MAASILQPWYLPSCLLFALTALVLGASSFLIRKYHRHLGKAWKTALVCAVVYVLMPVLEPYGFKLFLRWAACFRCTWCVMFALGGYVKALAGGTDEEEFFRPPQAAVWFEYCACVYALAYLVADAFPALDFVMTVAAMVSDGLRLCPAAHRLQQARAGQPDPQKRITEKQKALPRHGGELF